MRMYVLAGLALVAGGCSSKSSSSGGLPPASDWNASSNGVEMDVPEAPPNLNGNPHGGGGGAVAQPGPVDPNGPNPHGDHFPDMNGGGEGGGESDMVEMGTGGPDVAKLHLPAPDPNRVIDPTHVIRGVIKVDPKVASSITGSRPVFLSVKRFDANGQPTGMPVAVERLVWQKDELAFELTDRDAMVGTGDTLSGDVVVIAHYDQDGDAITKTSGDILGMARVKIPAENVVLTLDTPIP